MSAKALVKLSNPIQAVRNVVELKNDVMSGQSLFGPNGAIPKSLAKTPVIAGSQSDPVPTEAPLDPGAAPNPNANANLSAEQQAARARVGQQQGRASTLLSGSSGQSTNGFGGARTLLGY